MYNKQVFRNTAVFLFVLAFIAASALFTSCGGNQNSDKNEENGKKETRLFSISDVEMTCGDCFRIVPTFAPDADITFDEINYIVEEGQEVVTADGYYLTAMEKGSALIRAEYRFDRSVYSTFKVNVDMKGSLYKISDYVYASQKGGVYPSGFLLTLEPSNENYTIYYTTDCSTPTASSDRYSEPLLVRDQTKTGKYPLTKSVLSEPIDGAGLGKCVSTDYVNYIENIGSYPKVGCGTVITYSVYDGETLLETSSVTYIIKNNAEKYFTIPVVCLSMPYENWFDSEDGIYNIVYSDMKSRAYLEYYDPMSGEALKVNTSIKVGGGWSRGYPKRTLNLNFNRDENGNLNSASNVAFFGDVTKDGDGTTLLSSITRLRLHNSGNTYESGCLFGDALFQEIAKDTNCATTSYRPCVVYLNGEFWGYYGLREQYSDVFFENNYGVDRDDVIVTNLTGNSWNVTEGDPDASEKILKEFELYYLKYNFKSDSVYNEFIDKYIDKESFIDAIILEAFAHNWDYVANNNNFRMWRTSEIKEGVPYYDGKWRVCLHDLDFALQHNTGNYLVPSKYTAAKSNDYSYDKFPLYHKLLSNSSFVADLIARMKELFETVLSPERTTAILDRMAAELDPFFDDNAARWGITYKKKEWNDYITALRSRLSTRVDYFIATTLAMYEPFEYDASAVITLNNLKSDNSTDSSQSIEVDSRIFEVEFYVDNEEFSKNDAKAFIRFTSGDKHFTIYWGTGMTSGQWFSGSVDDGTDNLDIDYINIGKHKINIKYRNGTITLTVDDYFVKTVKVKDEIKTVDAFTFGSVQSKVSINRIRLIRRNGSGETVEITY